MAISYDEYVNKKKKKKKEEPKVVLGYSKNQNNVNNTPRSTTNTQTLIDRYIAEQKTKGDIAPVKKKEGDGLFSAFNDGYQLGDVSKTILKGGTKLGKAVYETGKEFVTNPVQTVKTGIVGIGEGLNKANDLTNDAVGDFFDFITGREKDKDEISINITELDRFSKTASKEEKQKVLKQYEKKYGKDSAMYKSVEVTLNAKQDKEDKNILTMKYYDTDTHKKAVEGELSEGQQNIYEIGQTVGNIIPATVVSTTLGPLAGKALFFTQAQQGYTEEALARGYSEKEARTYGLIMGGFEVAVERLGFDELGGLNKLGAGNVVKNMAGEGLEEFVMPYIDDVVTYVGFEDGYGWEEFGESSEEALEGAVMGAVVGGIFSAGGKGLAKVDNVITKASQGEKITQNDLIQARDELQEKSPETLQEAVVGVAEQIKNAKSIGGKQEEVQDITSEDIAPVPDELDVVEKLNENNIPILEGNEYQASATTDESVMRSQNYVYQASETDSTYRRNLNEDATKYANNTTRTHEFVNTLSNISEASGLNIRLTNNTSPEMTQRKQAMINSYAKRNDISVQEASERLKNIVIDGYNVNDQITINVNSPKALNRLVGHEITHSLEKTGEYKKNLQKLAIEYAKSKNDYKSRLDRLMDLYAGLNADINKELTADIIGDYLFTDQKFVDSIYKKDRNLFQRIYDEIKHLINMATAGSKEARELEKLKHSFEKAMRENKEMSKESKKATVQETKDKSATEVESNTQDKEDSVQKTEKEESSKVSETVEVKAKTEDKAESKIEENVEEYSLSDVDSEGDKLSEAQIEFFKDSKVRDENGNLLVIYHTMTNRGVQFNEFNPVGTPRYRFGDQVVNYFTNSKEMSGSYADYDYVMADTEKLNNLEEANKWLDDNATVYDFETKVNDDGTIEVDLKDIYDGHTFEILKFANEQEMVKKIKEKVAVFRTKHKYQYEGYLNITNPYIVEADGYNWNQASQEFSENIKERFESLTTEERDSLIKVSSQGKLAIRPVLERAYKDTEAVNGFSYYGTKYSSEDAKNLASAYVKLRKGAGMTPTYGSIYSVAEQRFKQMWIESASVVNLTTNDIVKRVLEENKHGSNYDGVIIYDVVDYGSEPEGAPEPNNVYVTFNSNQFKAKDNTNPTEDSDIRYSLSVSEANTTKDNKGRTLSKAVIERNKDSKTVDENGDLITVYHTMTDRGPQFNEFNPVGTDYYRFGDQIVNYYTDSKVMSGSYADQRYEMADTSKITSIDEVNQFLESFDNALTEYRLKELEDGKGYGITSFGGGTRLYFTNKEDLFKNVKEKLYNYEKQFGSKKGRAKFQYEGYVNLTNPYVVDAEGRSWSQVSREVDEKRVNEALNLTEQQKEDLIELRLQSDIGYQEHLDANRNFEYLQTALKNLPEMEQYHVMMDLPLDEPNAEMKYYNWVSSLMVETRESFAKKYRAGMDNYYNYKSPDTYFFRELNKVYNQEHLEPSELYQLASMEFTDSSTGEAFNREYYEKRYRKHQTTNDVVKQVIEMNKNGSNYDGVIMKNVVDYGGKANGDYSPANLYITFNSNQFKAWDNENPTDDPDIRYSLSEAPIIVENNEDISKLNFNPSEYQWSRPKVRGGWNIDKIQKQLKHESSGVINTKELSKFDNMDEVLNNTYYHGSISSHDRLKAGSTLKESERTGGYGEAYHSISLSGNRNIASNFASIGASGTVTPVILKKGANVIEMPNIEDSIELEDVLPELWAKNVDAVKIGDWDIEKVGYGEQEIVILNPEAIMTVPTGTTYFRNYQKPKFSNLTKEELAEAFIKAGQRSDEKSKWKAQEFIEKRKNGNTYYTEMSDEKFNALVNRFENQNAEQKYKDFINRDINMSLSRTDDVAPVGENDIFGSDIAVQEQVKEAIAPLQEQIETLTKTISDLQENMAPASFDLVEEQRAETQRTMSDEDAPLTDEGTFSFLDDEVKVKKKNEIINEIASDFNIKKTEARELYNKIESIPEVTIDDVYTELENYRKVKFKEQDDYIKSIQDYIKGTRLDISEIKKQIPDYRNVYRMANMGKGLILGNSGQSIDSFYQELNELYPNEFPSEVTAEADQLELISQAMFKEKELTYTDVLDDDELQILAERIYADIGNSERYRHTQSGLYFLNQEVKKMAPPGEINTNISEEEYADSLSTLNASNTEQIEENVSLDEELNKLDRQKGPSIKKNPFDEVLDKFLEGQRPGKPTATPKVEKSKYRNFRDTTQRLFVNEMVETDNLAKETGNLNIKYKGDMLNNVAGEIEGEIYTAQTDNEGHAIGKSLSELFAPAKEKGLYDAFNDYLEHYSNIDRHTQGKGSVVPLEESRRLVSHYERTYPEFKQWGKDVWQYGANVRDNLIDAGIISEEQAEALGTMYPHYVPYMENREMSNYNPDLGEIKPKGVIKRATGGAKNLLPIEEALIKYTFGYKKAIRQNQFYQEIVSTLEDKVEVGADVRTDPIELDDTLYKDETGNYLTAYFNGERQSVRISDDLYTGLKNDLKGQIRGLEEKFALITEPVQKLSEIRRNLLTSWNPMFIIKNPIMDIQDALFNSKHTKGFIKHYNIKTFIELANRSTETARQFLTLYGSGNVMGEHSSDGTVKNKNFLKGIQKANNVMELAPRYAEFKASLENGASLEEALYNAREVTTNFGRGGVITKALNKNGFTFLNVSVQGFDKFIRNFSGENGAKGVAGALLKASVLGVIPAIFNELAFGGDDEEKDEDYDALPDYIKDNYYLIKTGDGQFIRIPTGRMLSVFGSAGRRTLEYLQGEEDAFDGFLKNAYSQVGISNPLDSNILTPLIQAYGSENGEAWYGGDLVPTRLQGKAPEEQYDSSTDKFSIWLGDKLGISPYKLNYVIDQYSGGVGDIFLPFITEESTSDAEGVGMILAPIKDQFTANSTSDNKYAGDIYDLSDKMDKMPTATKETDDYKIKDAYLYSVTSEMGKLYAERRAVQENKKLSKKEKYEKVQAIQKQINDLAKEGLDNYQNVSKTDNYAIVGGREFNKYTSEDGTKRWGAVREEELEALNSYGLDLMEKSSYFNAKTYISKTQERYKNTEDYTQKKRDIISVIRSTLLTDEAKAYLYDKYYGNADTLNAITTLGIDFDKYLDLEYQNFEADKNSEGKSISGSKKAKVFNYINSMDLSFEEKVILTKLQYNSYDEHNGAVINYINNYDMTYEQRVNILEKLGFKVDEYGNIFW